MANTIRLKSGSGNNPSASDLVVGEVALRTDGNPKLFTKNDAGSVLEVGLVESGSIVAGSIVNADINASAAIAGTKISPDFGSQDITTTGSLTGNGLTINSTFPRIILNDSDHNSDFSLYNANGFFRIFDDTASASRFHIASDGTVEVAGNLDVGAGIDVTGNITATGKISINSTTPILEFNESDGNPDYRIFSESGAYTIQNLLNGTYTTVFKINSDGHTDIAGNLDCASGIDVTGDISVSGTVDGVDIAARDTLFGGLTSSSGVLTNGVTATTQSAGDNSTKVATTAYTDTAITNLVDSSPSALNTLNELAAALGDDANFSTTVTNSIATKLPLAGGTLTGNVTYNDNVKAIFGTHSDLEIVHNSSENHFNFSANTFFKGNNAWGVRNSSNQNILQISGTNRTVELYGGSVRVISTASSKLTVRGGIEIENGEFNMTTNGNKVLDFETGGTNFVNFRHNPSDSSLSTFMKAIHGGAVELYHDASGTKTFETTSTGIQVDGSDTNLTIRSGTASGSAGGLINFKNVDGNGVARDVARIKGFSDGTGGYGEITFQTAFNDSLNDVLRITKEQRLEIIGSNQYPVTIDGSDNGKIVLQGSSSPYIRFREGTTDKAFIQWHPDGYLRLQNQEDAATLHIKDNFVFSPDNSSFYTIWHSGNDGSGSGLDADTLDGQQGSYYRNASNLNAGTIDDARLPATITSNITGTANNSEALKIVDTRNDGARVPNDYAAHKVTAEFTNQVINGWWSAITVKGWANGYAPWQLWGKSDTTQNINLYARFGHGGNNTWSSLYTIWHSGVDGSGSGLDADTLDGVDGANYVRTNQNTTITSDLFIGGGAGGVTVNAGSDIRFSNGNWTGNVNGTAKIQHHSNYLYIAGGTSGIIFRENDTNRWIIDGDGHLDPAEDSTYDIGSNGVRVRNGYFDTLYGDGSNLTGLTVNNAQTLDNLDSTQFLRSDAADSFSGNLTGSSGTNIKLDSNIGLSGNTAYASMAGYLEFTNDYSDAARGANKIRLQSDNNWLAGFGISANSHDIYTGGNFNFYKSNSTTSFTNLMSLSSTGQLGTAVQGVLWGASNDGSGSGLDADTVDGIQASSFLRSDADDTATGTLTINNTSDNEKIILAGSNNPYIRFQEGTTDKAYIQWNASGWLQLSNSEDQSGIRIKDDIRFTQDNFSSEHKIWHGVNDGSGSGLDSDTLDGVQGSSYLRSDAEDTITAPLNINAGTANAANDATLYVTATNNNDWGLVVNKNYSGSSEYGVDIRVGGSANYGLRVLGSGSDVFRITGSGTVYAGGSNLVFHAGNDGSGSGLDADTLDGIQGANFVRSDTGDTLSGNYNTTGTWLIGGAYANNSYNSVSSTRLLFGGGNDADNYHIGTNMENYGGNYTKLDLRWHTGIRMGAQAVYGGIRFFNNEDLNGSVIFSVGKGDGNTRIESGELYHNTSGTSDKYWREGNDGSGSGLDADTLDGVNSGSFARSDASDTLSGDYDFTGGADAISITSSDIGSSGSSNWTGDPGASRLKIQAHSNRWYIVANGNSNRIVQFRQNGTDRTWIANDGQIYHGSGGSGDKYWRQGNDGSGSGLDADTLDGINSGSFLRSDANDDLGGTLSYTSDTARLQFTNSSYGQSLHIGGWTSANSAGISRIRNSNDNLHIDCGANGGLYLNYYAQTLIYASTIIPRSNNTFDLGTSTARWRNLYINDLNLSNEGSTNDVDGTWGSYTIQEGAEELYLINKRNGKKYKFNLTEVS